MIMFGECTTQGIDWSEVGLVLSHFIPLVEKEAYFSVSGTCDEGRGSGRVGKAANGVEMSYKR